MALLLPQRRFVKSSCLAGGPTRRGRTRGAMRPNPGKRRNIRSLTAARVGQTGIPCDTGKRPFLTTYPRPGQDDARARRALAARQAMITARVPAATTPLEVARALAPRIREQAAAIEAARQLPAHLVMDIANARSFRV